MSEKYITEYIPQSVDAIDKFAAERGVARIDAIQHLITIGGYVSDGLLAGKEFIVKDGKSMHIIDWQLPPSLDQLT